MQRSDSGLEALLSPLSAALFARFNQVSPFSRLLYLHFVSLNSHFFLLASTHSGCSTHFRGKIASLVFWLNVYCKKGAYSFDTREHWHYLCEGYYPNFHHRFDWGNFGLFWIKIPLCEAAVAHKWSILLILGWGIRICHEKLLKINILLKIAILRALIEHF